MNDRIEKRIELKAPISRVWRAVTDYREFGEWFRVKLDGPFGPGQVSHGQITYPGYEHLKWEADVVEIDPDRLFSFAWRQPTSLAKPEYAQGDQSKHQTTLVEFGLGKAATGT